PICPGSYPNQLDEDCSQDRDDRCGEHGRGTGEQSQGHTGQRDGPDTVTEQGQTSLHQKSADGRGDQTDEYRGDKGPAHEFVLEEVSHCGVPRSGSSPRGRIAVRWRRGLGTAVGGRDDHTRPSGRRLGRRRVWTTWTW